MKAAIVLVATLLASLSMLAAEQGVSPVTSSEARSAVECTPRSGLPNFLNNATKGGAFKIAYLGGSITAQPGWRVKSLAWFNDRYPQSKFTEINAAIGGTGSDLGVLRIEHDVFKARPDLLFVEFAVNDGGTAPQEIVRSMEGIVRKTWIRFPACDICFVYTFTEKFLPELKAGKLNRSAAVTEAVADHYGIPSIHLGLEAVRLESAGKLLMKAPEAKLQRVSDEELNVGAGVATGPDGKVPFSKDGVHPYVDTGHQLYMAAIERSIPVLRKASGEGKAHALPPPLDPENYSKTVMLALDDLRKGGPWTRLPADAGLGKSFRARVDSLWKASPGAELTFKFRGSGASAYDLLGPDCGSVEIVVDGHAHRLLRIDGYCTYSRLGLFRIAGGLDPTGVHEVTIRVSDETLRKDEILFEQNRVDLTQHPEKYSALNWYPGAIFVVGEVIQ